MNKIGVIIPTYRALETIEKTLHSIAMQSISKEITIYIVNDCDGLDYSDIIAKFNLNIKYVQNEINKGCGGARNTGIKTAIEDYIVFIDADDQFSNPLALEIMYNTIRQKKADVLICAFESEMRFDNGVAIRKIEGARTWMHGKCLRRQYLIDNNLFFKENLRLNEDVEFNQIMIDMGAKVVEIPLTTYLWRDNPKSITHESLYENKKWFVLASAEYLRDCAERGLNNERVTKRVLQNLCVIYDYLNIVRDDCPENEEDYLNACRDYWQLCAPIVANVGDEEITNIYLQVMKQQCGVISTITFTDFLGKIRN